LNRQTLADPPNLLGCARKDKVLKKLPVVTHTTRGMVVDAKGKQVAVKSGAGGSGQWAATSLEGKADAARPTELLDDGVVGQLYSLQYKGIFGVPHKRQTLYV
jgi:hypothetical protein